MGNDFAHKSLGSWTKQVPTTLANVHSNVTNAGTSMDVHGKGALEGN